MEYFLPTEKAAYSVQSVKLGSGKVVDIDETIIKVRDGLIYSQGPKKRTKHGRYSEPCTLVRVPEIFVPMQETVVLMADIPSEFENESEQSGTPLHFDLACVQQIQVDSLGDRLNVLQQLLPHGSKLDTEEVLKVAVDYVKALEKEIQMFNKTKQDSTALDRSHMDGLQPNHISAESLPCEGSALHKRGLCIMPLSALANAL
eukprot:c13753_g1_i1 orf=246-851(+)